MTATQAKDTLTALNARISALSTYMDATIIAKTDERSSHSYHSLPEEIANDIQKANDLIKGAHNKLLTMDTTNTLIK